MRERGERGGGRKMHAKRVRYKNPCDAQKKATNACVCVRALTHTHTHTHTQHRDLEQNVTDKLTAQHSEAMLQRDQVFFDDCFYVNVFAGGKVVVVKIWW